jgi:large subunit ribosomal protein L15
VDVEILKSKGLVKKVGSGVKILGEGEVLRPLTVRAQAFSLSAKKKIEAAGGKAEVI